MGRYFSRICKALSVSTLGFGGGVALFVMIVIVTTSNDPQAFNYAWKAGLTIGLIFAVLLVAVLLPLDLFARMFLAKGIYKGIFELEQVREVKMQGTSKEVLAACREALLKIPYVKSVSDDSEQMITRARTGTSWRSSGEELEVEMNPIAENSWILRCSSKPKSPTAVFDYGKNFENVETWLSRMKSTGSTA
ncbi:MAG: hypothetical protein K2X93_12515 [Candidatus Obscuribacterales bacterium]|nr:hypothetical protein [Candidatus Obscuribacterales bacterium]